MLAISFSLMVVVGLVNKIFSKLETIPMHNYPYFMSLFGAFIYIPTSFAYIIPMIKYGNAISEVWSSRRCRAGSRIAMLWNMNAIPMSSGSCASRPIIPVVWHHADEIALNFYWL
jgi:hypothetical protein